MSSTKTRAAMALCVLGLTCIGATFYFATRQAQDEARRRADTNLQSAVNALRLDARLNLERVRTMIDSAANAEPLVSAMRVRGEAAASSSIQALTLEVPAITGVAVYDNSGWLVTREPRDAERIGPAGPQGDPLSVTATRLVENDTTLTFKRPITGSEGAELGSLVVEVSLRRSVPGIYLFRMGTTGRASIIDPDGRILLSGQPERFGTTIRAAALRSVIKDWRFDTTEHFSPTTGRDEFIGFGPATDKLGVLVTTSKTEIMDPVIDLGWSLMVGLFAVMAAIAGAAVLAARAMRDQEAETGRRLEEAADRGEVLPAVEATLRRVHSNISGLVETLRERGRDLTAETYGSLLGRIDTNLGGIHRLSERMRYTYLLSSGSSVLRAEPCILKTIAEEAIRDVAMDLNRHRIQIVVADDLKVSAEDRGLRQVLGELVSNAARFSSPGSLIIIRARRSEEGVIISVDDEGVGVDPESIPDLFKQRLPTSGAQGQGIGLWISAGLVDRMGGKIWCEPEIQRGSTFSVRLPDVPAVHKHLRVVDTDDGVRTA